MTLSLRHTFATDDAITVKVDRDAFQKDTDVHVQVDILKKDSKGS